MARRPLSLVLVGALALGGCGKSLTPGNGATYDTYGFFNAGSSKSSSVCYEVSAGNVVWSVILIETLVFPIYFLGFSLFNPVRLKNGPHDTCEAP